VPNKLPVGRDLDKVMAALGSSVRREILGLIWDRELPAGEIAAAFALTKPTISQHLAVLREAGLVTMTAAGTSRRYRAVPDALRGLHGAVAGAGKWDVADDLAPAQVRTQTHAAVTVAVDVDVDQPTTFAALTDAAVYGRWLGVPVTLADGRFAATMEWGTEVRGRYVLVVPPELIVMEWDFEDDNVPVPGNALTGYLHVRARGRRGATVEVHQLVDSLAHTAFMETAWSVVLDRLRTGVAAASNPAALTRRRPPRPKRRASA
jgi:DNA-binding transcriptional ArsR family regulator